MVLGLKSRRQNSGSVQLEYIVRVMEIKPWPTSEPLKSNQSILLHWEHSDKKTGSLSSTVGNAKVEFNGLFVLPLTLVRDKKGVNKFQKNLLEFQVYETSKDRTNKGQIFGTAMVNLADYGIIEENLTLSVPLSCKKGYKNVQPVLFLKLQPIDKDSLNSSPKSSVSKESVSGLTSEDIDHEFEIASFTDDDVSPQSSLNFKQTNENSNASSPLFYNGGNHVKYPRFPERTMTLIHNKKSVIPRFKSSSSSVGFQNKHADPDGKIKEKAQLDMDCSGDVCVIRPKGSIDSKGENKEKAQLDMDCSGNACVGRPKGSIKVEDRTVDKTQETVRVQQDEQSKPVDKFFQGESRSIDDHKLRNVKSVRLPHDSARVQTLKTEKASATCNAATQTNEAMSGFSDSKVEVHSRIEMLEEELREAAAIEVSLYSVVAEHGGSTNKVHAPARRLSRFYLHACNSRNQARMAGAARAAVSGLVLVSKACGNDVPRLTFWLSNSIMLRAIISHAVKSNNGGGSVSSDSVEESEETATFTIALETIEAWIFSRIIESIWWQTLTPYMQSTAAKACNKPVGSGSTKPNRGSHGLSNQDQGNFSVELWKKAFKDACERLCPIRASGHECGCLPLLPRMVMEQLVGRLDVAMFNAILRESAEEMPTDPVSDPICDSYVLPIPVGKSSFGSGAQLKNAIGDWSRWLTDLFDIEDTPENDTDNKSIVKPFRLLNALSDLMMLPPEILSDKPTRKEVCPAFAAPVIRRVLEVFVPDNFCPQRVPKSVLDALDSEDDLELDGESIRVIPCGASSTTYSPPTAASITNIIGDIDTHTLKRSGSSVMKKSYNSDDELDELDSPLASIIADGFHGSSPSLRKPIGFLKGNSGRNIVRYQLLREVWKEGEQ